MKPNKEEFVTIFWASILFVVILFLAVSEVRYGLNSLVVKTIFGLYKNSENLRILLYETSFLIPIALIGILFWLGTRSAKVQNWQKGLYLSSLGFLFSYLIERIIRFSLLLKGEFLVLKELNRISFVILMFVALLGLIFWGHSRFKKQNSQLNFSFLQSVLFTIFLIINFSFNWFNLIFHFVRPLGVIEGRPFRKQGKSEKVLNVVASDSWIDHALQSKLKDQAREGEVENILNLAIEEHAAIASFSQLSLDLLAVGAPAHLVEAALTAALDEVRHAKTCFTYASHCAQKNIGPESQLKFSPRNQEINNSRIELLKRIATESLKDGYENEGRAADRAEDRSKGFSEKAVKDIWKEIAREERGHSALGLAIYDWCKLQLNEPSVELKNSTICNPSVPLS